MKLRCNYTIALDREGEPLVIRDEGPWDQFMTVTNNAEAVVPALVRDGHLPPGRRLLYIDSAGDMDEILVKNGRFAGFRVLSKERTPCE